MIQSIQCSVNVYNNSVHNYYTFHCVYPQEKLLWFAGIKTGEYAHTLATHTTLTGRAERLS